MADDALKERLKSLRASLKDYSSSTSTPPTITTVPRSFNACSINTSLAPTPEPSRSREIATSAASLTPRSQTSRLVKANSHDDPDKALFERLRTLNPTSSILTSKATARASLTTGVADATKDDIEALIRQTQDELAVEEASGAFFTQDIDSEESDTESPDSIQALAVEADNIVSMARDAVALERQMGTIPAEIGNDLAAQNTREAGSESFGRAMTGNSNDSDLEDALADAAQHDIDVTSDIEPSTPLPANSPLRSDRGSGRGRRSLWSGRGVFFVVMVTLIVLAVSSVPGAYAFGAGNIPSFAYMEGKAFRHGDIEDILEDLAKKVGGGLFGAAKFGGLDIKRIYFGNWLRDYSQAMDVAALQKMNKQAVLNIVMVLGFLAHGYATAEFQVTDDRLGVYLPEEHLDNPKGYADGKDARQFDPRLREPVRAEELEIDPRSGMKNYLANESGNWRTGSGLIRRTLKRVIEMGRQARSSGRDADLYEAYRLLGQALHTLEDFPAHSNWTELALHRLGHHQVFLHVGDNVKVRAPDGTMVAPIVTGTFGGADFMHSLLGEAQDHLSEASISDLNKAIDKAKVQSSGNNRSVVQDLLGMLAKVPGAGGSDVSRGLEEVSRGPATDPNTMSPQEMYKNLWKILELRDRIMKSIESTIEKIPGLSSLVEKLTNELNVFVFTLIEPYAKPIMQQGMSALKLGSGAVVNQASQFEVFDDMNASDPTHSILSKDHFGLILNEVAGNVAKIIVRHTVVKVVKAWDDRNQDAEHVADECLAPMFHPYWFNGQSQVQKDMMDYVAQWAQSHATEIRRLDKQNVRNHTNTRSGKAEPHTHGNDQPSMGSFLGGGSSHAANSFNNHHGNASGSGGNSFGSNMAGYASNYVSNQMHGFVGSHMPAGANQFFREGPGGDATGGRSEGDAPKYGGQEGRRFGSNIGDSDDQPRPHHTGESSSYYGDNVSSSGNNHQSKDNEDRRHDRPSFPDAQPSGHQSYGSQDHPPAGFAAPMGPPPGQFGGPLQGSYGAPPPGGYGGPSGPPGGFGGYPGNQGPPGPYGQPPQGYGGQPYPPPPGTNQWNSQQGGGYGGGGYGGGYGGSY